MSWILKTLFLLHLTNVMGYAEEYSFQIMDIGTLQADSSTAFAINDDNHVIGKYSLSGQEYFFLWKEGEIELIDLPPSAIPKSINIHDQICGQYVSDGNIKSFFFDPVKGLIDIGTLGGINIWAENMNDKGEIVGYAETGFISNIRPDILEIHAFIWKDDSLIDLGVLKGDIGQGGDDSRAYGINNAGEIIGYSNYTLVHKGKKFASADKACVWIQSSINEIFPDDHVGASSQGIGLNNYGEMIVLRESQPGLFDLVYYNFKSRATSPVVVCFGRYIAVNKINDNAVMIGSPYPRSCIIANYPSEYGTYHNDLPYNRDFYWSILNGVFGINNKNIIVGEAQNLFGEIHAVILVPNYL